MPPLTPTTPGDRERTIENYFWCLFEKPGNESQQPGRFFFWGGGGGEGGNGSCASRISDEAGL